MTILDTILDILDNATRIGAEKDTPEGARYIQISDTLANKLAENLRPYAGLKSPLIIPSPVFTNAIADDGASPGEKG